MSHRIRRAAVAGAGLGAVLVLPLIGALLAGRDVAPVFQFPPPLTIPRGYPHFSWIAFSLVLAPFALLGSAWVRHRRAAARRSPIPARADPVRRGSRLPPWGWISAGWTAAWWVLAWSRFPWFAPFQRFTFFPLWLGFIVSVNAITFSRSGTCAMLGATRRWLGLFAASACFWWVFEWLNRFARNWHYLGVADFGAAAYALNATICFSTVLPAVAAVAELIGTSAHWERSLAAGPALPILGRRSTAFALGAAALAVLIGIGAEPRRFYAGIWAAPAGLMLAAEILGRRDGLAFDAARGDWRRAAKWPLAALACGVFWELWNFHSAAKWIYTVPYADRWHVFEMPLLGYAGYLPFGLECHFVAAGVMGGRGGGAFSSESST